jgi:2-amino-4-hydroxy-6-hydroxymethyldihydropteridine diphosphokinase
VSLPEVESGWHRAVVALGSNLGERDEELFRALADLKATEGIRVVAESSIHETVALTEAGYDERAPRYLNQVVIIDTVWDPHALLQITLGIEANHGRERTDERYASRTLDIDLIDYDAEELESEGLTLPHPRAHERAFVLAPWVEINAHATIAGKGTVSDLLRGLDKAGQ